MPGWVMFTTIRVLSGDPPGPALADQVRRITSPTPLIAAGTAEEREFSRRVVDFFDRALGDARRPGTSTAAG